jgi:signal transduction histidine kinase
MLSAINFSLSPAEMVSLFTIPLFLIVLSVVARINAFQDRNAIQLFLTSLVIFLFWASMLFFIGFQDIFLNEMISSFMMLVTILLIYLEIWALLSRGYTLGILLTLAKSTVPLNEREISRSYRAGQGLEWLVHHRFSSLFATNLIAKQGNKIYLTPFLGKFVVSIYKLFIFLFSLKKTG